MPAETPAARIGRPRKDAAELRCEVLRVRLTPTERANIDARAAQAGLPVSDFARRALTSVKIEARRAGDGAIPAALVADLGRVGNNLNQVAHAANIGRELRGLAETALAELRGLVSLITEKLDQ